MVLVISVYRGRRRARGTRGGARRRCVKGSQGSQSHLPLGGDAIYHASVAEARRRRRSVSLDRGTYILCAGSRGQQGSESAARRPITSSDVWVPYSYRLPKFLSDRSASFEYHSVAQRKFDIYP